MTRAPRLLCAVTLAVLATAAPARAQGPAGDSELRADQLFKDGVAKFDAGQISEACSSFLESLRLEPKLGTLLNLALCHEKQGKTATAWSEYNHGAAWATQNGQSDRREFANRHAILLEPRLSRLLLRLPPAGEISQVEVDGEPLPEPRWYLPIFLDPGNHTIAVDAPGKKRRSVVIRVPIGPSAQSVPVPTLEEDPNAPSASTGRAAKPSPPTSERPRSSSGGARSVLGGIALGVSAAAIGAGSYFGLRTFSKRDDIGNHCVDSKCDPLGLELQDDAHTSATISTISFAVGGLALAAGLYLLITAPAVHSSSSFSASVAPMMGPHTGGLAAAAAW
jgi:hypothetical protein